MAKNRTKSKVIFRDGLGRFLPQAKRFTKDVAMIQAVRNGRYIKLADRPLQSKDLTQILSRTEYESLHEALESVKNYTSKKKYKAWDIAEQIDKTKGIRRKDMKFTIEVDDGGRKKSFSFYHQIKKNSTSSYQLFRRINQELGLERMFLYDKVGGKLLPDRTGKKVTLIGIRMEKVV
jgi:hypothetical protein